MAGNKEPQNLEPQKHVKKVTNKEPVTIFDWIFCGSLLTTVFDLPNFCGSLLVTFFSPFFPNFQFPNVLQLEISKLSLLAISKFEQNSNFQIVLT